jgi:hypothetical protein
VVLAFAVHLSPGLLKTLQPLGNHLIDRDLFNHLLLAFAA